MTSTVLLPNRVAWHVDLSIPAEQSWSPSTLKKIKNQNFNEVEINWLEAKEIKERFITIYERLIMSRDDYRLDREKTLSRLMQNSTNEAYKLVWVTRKSGEILGGVVLKLEPEIAKIAYRTFDHQLVKGAGYKGLDYYIDFSIFNKTRLMGKKWLSHGSDMSPVTQVGLSCFKLRVGARPVVSSKAEMTEIDPLKYVGYYADPIENKYTSFVWLNRTGNEVEKQFESIANHVGIKLTTLGG